MFILDYYQISREIKSKFVYVINKNIIFNNNILHTLSIATWANKTQQLS